MTTTLDNYLTTQPGRCPHCGAHLKLQADLHVGGCLTAAVRDRDAGQAQASAARPADAARVEAAIRSLLATGEPFSANQARDIHGVKGGVVGATFTALSKANVIRAVGAETSTDRGTHGKPVALYVAGEAA